MFVIIFNIWVVFILIGTLIPLLREQIWWLRAWTYARLQLLALSLLTFVISFWMYPEGSVWGLIIPAILVVCVILCLRDIIPFTPLAQTQSKRISKDDAHNPLSLFIANVLMENSNFDKFLSEIKEADADLVFLVETDEKWRTNLSDLEQIYPHQYLLPLEEFNGMLFYSKFPIVNVQERYLVQDHIPSLTIDLEIAQGREIRFFGVHPRPPRPEDDTSDLDEELIIIANEVANTSKPVIVTGDLNDVGWSTTTKRFLEICGCLDPRRGRGLYNSYNAKNPLVRWPLDHLFHSKDFGLVEMMRKPAHGSDHFPIMVTLDLRNP